MRCGNVPVENNANRFLLYPILWVSSSYTLKLAKSVNFIIYRCILSLNFIRLLQVIIIPSVVVERRKQLKAIG